MEGGPNIQEATDSQSLVAENEERGCKYLFCHPRGTMHRFIALVFMCLLGFGSYFCFDNPAALEKHMEQDLDITAADFMWLYSIYSWPNVVLCFIGGFLIDRLLGIRLGAIIFMGFTLLGQVVFAAAAFYNIFPLMIVGRFIFGIGGESLAVAQNSYAVLWFKGKELNMVFGLQLSFARIGSTVNFLVVDDIYTWVKETYSNGPECLGIVLFIAGLTCIFSMVCALILGYMDKRAERITERHLTASSEVVRLRDIFKMPLVFWLISTICVAYYVAIFPFIGLGEGFFHNRFKMTEKAANTVNSIVYLISGFASPVLGFLIDKTGKNITWILVAICSTVVAHSLLAFTLINPYVGMSLMGLSYSCLASSLWPLVALIIPEYQLGTAYGVCQAVQNLGLAVFAIVAGNIVNSFGYLWMEVFFICCLGVALICAIGLWFADRYRSGILNMTPGDRLQLEQKELAATILEREKLLDAEEEPGTSNPPGTQEPSDFQIRNRYLSRIGAPLPDHYNILK